MCEKETIFGEEREERSSDSFAPKRSKR